MTTLLEYLDRRLGAHRGRGPEHTWHCPACIDRIGSESDTPKLHVNIDRRVGHCFRCDFGFRSFEGLFRYINNGKLTLEEGRLLRRAIRQHPDGPIASVIQALGREHKRKFDLRPVRVPREMVDLTVDPLPMTARRAMSYLTRRGVGLEEIAHHSIGFCPAGDYGGYLVFPVHVGGRQVYFTTRFAGQSRMKSKNPPKADGYHTKATVLLNYDACVGEKLIGIVEGPFDMMAWGNAVGLMGKDISDEQVVLIEALVDHGLEEVVVSLDAEAGREAIAVYRKLVGRVPNVSILFLDDGDPFDRRDELDTLLRDRREPTPRDFVTHRATVRRKVRR